ncbi:hypothetical protein BDW74DRAFT_171787 [Aspergillus multicolor]|uniref:uncharacterized protein n=1 Tax=Aspergillus multicolor TaxID=41759 RepID=UPI003CCD9265
MENYPKADVIWWNKSSYYIQCPFCTLTHRHGVNGASNRLRVSHCGRGKSYLCCFPMNERGEVAYEIDKTRGRYVNICLSEEGREDNDDDVDDLATGLTHKATLTRQREESHGDIHEDSSEVVLFDLGPDTKPFEQKAILGAISDCVLGYTDALDQYLETSPEATLFIRGRDSDGKTTLVYAAAEQSSEMVSLLIEHGADTNAVDNHGRSALMEAALWGRVENVKVLLEHGANKDSRDDENRAAVDFAQDSYRNRQERYQRAGGNATHSSKQRLVYNEDTFKRDIDRREIVHLLGGENMKYSFKPSPLQNSRVLHGPIQEYPITKCSATVARLERGGRFPSIGSMSGWAHSSMQGLRVDSRHWRNDVFYISELVVHRLPPHPCDHGRDGQFYACHAEKQLIAYFIDRHVFLPRDGIPDPKLEREIEQVEDELQSSLLGTEVGRNVASLRTRRKDLDTEFFDGDEKLIGKDDEIKALKRKLKSVDTALHKIIATPPAQPLLQLEARLERLRQQQKTHEELIEMAHEPPPASLTAAVILISKDPCPNCVEFKNKVNRFFGLSIQLYAAT